MSSMAITKPQIRASLPIIGFPLVDDKVSTEGDGVDRKGKIKKKQLKFNLKNNKIKEVEERSGGMK